MQLMISRICGNAAETFIHNCCQTNNSALLFLQTPAVCRSNTTVVWGNALFVHAWW